MAATSRDILLAVSLHICVQHWADLKLRVRGPLAIRKGDVNLVVIHKLNMDLKNHEKKLRICVPQWDVYTRQLKLRLFSGKEPWQIPEDAAVMICYYKPDGTKGEYDSLPNGERAWNAAGNELCITLAPQVLTAVGEVKLYARLMWDEKVLNTFAVEICVTHPAGGVYQEERLESENYQQMTGILPSPESAQIGQYIRVLEVDDRGRVLRVEAADLQAVGGVDLTQVRRIVEEYLAANPPAGAGTGIGIVNITIEEV